MTSQPQGRLTVPVSDTDHTVGPADAPVTLVEYGDFECPYCGRAYPIVKAVQGQLGERLRFVFRNFPLGQMHPHADGAAEAAEAAGAQGRFWEMHSMLFENQHALEHGDLVRYAGVLGLDVARFENELRDGTHTERVREHFMSGVRSGVNGTPTFFINGVRHDAGYDLEALLAAIESARAIYS
jgi:protein-disulfide isomerase